MQLCRLCPFAVRELPFSKWLPLSCSAVHAPGWLAGWQWSVGPDSYVMFVHVVLRIKKNHEASTIHDVLFNTSISTVTLLWLIFVQPLSRTSPLHLFQHLSC